MTDTTDPSPTTSRDGLREALDRVATLAMNGDTRVHIADVARAALAASPSPQPDPVGLNDRRKAAADLCAATAARLAALGFGCEIIATWEAHDGERTAAHIITVNPDQTAAGGGPVR